MLLQLHVRRPNVDMGSSSFSHAERFLPKHAPMTELIDDVEVIGQLDPSYPIGVSGLTVGATSFLTFTYDKGLFTEADARAFVDGYARQLEDAKDLA